MDRLLSLNLCQQLTAFKSLKNIYIFFPLDPKGTTTLRTFRNSSVSVNYNFMLIGDYNDDDMIMIIFYSIGSIIEFLLKKMNHRMWYQIKLSF